MTHRRCVTAGVDVKSCHVIPSVAVRGVHVHILACMMHCDVQNRCELLQHYKHMCLSTAKTLTKR